MQAYFILPMHSQWKAGGTEGNLVHLEKRLCSVASANGAEVDRWNHRSRSPGCLANYGTYTVNGMIPPLSDG